jgi:1,2-diacylglycerol 3-beta-galactosyltransferase
MTKRTILFLMSDTGGGHRAAAEALRDSLNERYPEQYDTKIVDVFVEYSPPPWNNAPAMYPFWINRGKLTWWIGYHLSNNGPLAELVNSTIRWQVGGGLVRLFRENPAAVVVNVHPMMATPAFRALQTHHQRAKTPRPPFITLVTDLVTTHALWYQPDADRTLVPTAPALEHGAGLGVDRRKMRVTGLPVHPRFAAGLVEKATARATLGWSLESPVVMLVGGGAGMGPLFEIAEELDMLPHPFQIVVIAGRNAALKARLEAKRWTHPTHFYGFMTNMPELMAAADLLVTKAGPATICEACMAGLPVILSDAIPGQEYGNVRYIVDHGAGLYANTPSKVRVAAGEWLGLGADFLRERSALARSLAFPDAARTIVEEIHQAATRKTD